MTKRSNAPKKRALSCRGWNCNVASVWQLQKKQRLANEAKHKLAERKERRRAEKGTKTTVFFVDDDGKVVDENEKKTGLKRIREEDEEEGGVPVKKGKVNGNGGDGRDS